MYLNDKLPQIETESKVDPYTLPALIAWLKTKNATEVYDYGCIHGGCLIGQYFSYAKIPFFSIGGTTYYRTAIDGERALPVSFGVIALEGRHTFGAALARAEALAREAP